MWLAFSLFFSISLLEVAKIYLAQLGIFPLKSCKIILEFSSKSFSISFINETKDLKDGTPSYSVTELVFSNISLGSYRENQTQFLP